MTVIACRGGVMAADTSSWHGDIRSGSARKIWRLGDGSLFAAGGWKPVIGLALEWLDAGAQATDRQADAAEGDLDGLILRPDGRIWCLTHRFMLYRSDRDYDVAGAHHEFLHGAMLAGASAEEAVRLAIRHCARAAGEVQVEQL